MFWRQIIRAEAQARKAMFGGRRYISDAERGCGKETTRTMQTASLIISLLSVVSAQVITARWPFYGRYFAFSPNQAVYQRPLFAHAAPMIAPIGPAYAPPAAPIVAIAPRYFPMTAPAFAPVRPPIAMGPAMAAAMANGAPLLRPIGPPVIPAYSPRVILPAYSPFARPAYFIGSNKNKKIQKEQ